MDYLNLSDLNGDAHFEAVRGHARFPVHVASDGVVSVEQVPGDEGTQLVVVFSSDAGDVRAAVRMADLLHLVRAHYPKLLEVSE